jgi:hypothetical protein
MCRRDDKGNIEAYGFGKGFEIALPEWRTFLRRLEDLQAAKPMHVILIGHARLATFKNPEGPDYDRWGFELHPKAAGVLKKWLDTVLFANFETFALKNEQDKKPALAFAKGKAVSSGARHLYTERTAAFDAKNRFGLPPQMVLDWNEFYAGVQRGADPAVLIDAITRKAEQLGPDDQVKVRAKLEAAGTDTDKLILLNNVINSKLTEKIDTKRRPRMETENTNLIPDNTRVPGRAKQWDYDTTDSGKERLRVMFELAGRLRGPAPHLGRLLHRRHLRAHRRGAAQHGVGGDGPRRDRRSRQERGRAGDRRR